MRYLILLFIIAVASCQSNTVEEQGHSHAADGGHGTEEIGSITVDTTVWTDKTELFVEFPALVVGEISRFAAHFTIMDNHRPVDNGKVTVSLIKGNAGIRNSVDAPTSPGIFTPALKPKEAGMHRLVFEVESPKLSDRIEITGVEVFESAGAAEKAIGSGSDGVGGEIPLLKEQAWRIPFQTKHAVSDTIYDIIPTSGSWNASPGDARTLTASVSGIVGFAVDNLTEGTAVREGQLLMTLSSEQLTDNNLQAKIEKARADFEQARSAWKRKKQLYEKDIVPESEFEHVENRYRVAKASYETLRAGYTAKGKQIRAPFEGYVKSVNVANGDYAGEGAPLVTLGTRRSRLLKAHASPSYASRLRSIQNIYYQPEAGRWSSLQANGGRLLSVGKKVENDNPMIPVFAKVNEPVEMPEGSFTEVQIAVGNPREGVIVPQSALLEDYGNYSLIVQLSGESFERRMVQLGRQNGDMVEITEGLKTGEIIVTRGAYQVRMASMSGQGPAHGHVH
jgi:RND family efflux transporter MFP subunit